MTLTDALPSGYTLTSTVTGIPDWNCSGNTGTTVNCVSTSVIAGAGGAFETITVNASVPANSPTSVTNHAGVYGGGDLTHNVGNQATIL